MRFRSCSSAWWGLAAYLASLIATLLLANGGARPWALLPLIGAAVLAIMVWGRQEWSPAFPQQHTVLEPDSFRSRFVSLLGVTIALLLTLAAGFRYLVAPNETFGLAGSLWLGGIGVLLCSVLVGSRAVHRGNESRRLRWTTWEIVIVAGLVLLAVLTRTWDLSGFPDNIYPDEVMTGTMATQCYITDTGPAPSVFSTVWGGIDLPALWFWIVSRFLEIGGSTLAMLRLPAALFGAATVLPLYGLIRGSGVEMPQ